MCSHWRRDMTRQNPAAWISQVGRLGKFVQTCFAVFIHLTHFCNNVIYSLEEALDRIE